MAILHFAAIRRYLRTQPEPDPRPVVGGGGGANHPKFIWGDWRNGTNCNLTDKTNSKEGHKIDILRKIGPQKHHNYTKMGCKSKSQERNGQTDQIMVIKNQSNIKGKGEGGGGGASL